MQRAIILLLPVFFLSCYSKEVAKEAISDSPVNSTTYQLTDSIQQQKCTQELIRAIEQSDLETLELFISEGYEVNGNTQLNHLIWDSPLRQAVHYNDTSIVKLLLEHGADPNRDLKTMPSPFRYAAMSGSLTMLNLLYRYQGDVNDYNRHDDQYASPLLSAIAGNNLENAKFIIEHGGKIDPDSINGFNSPLMAAASNRNIEMMKLLFRKGANVNATLTDQRWDECPCKNGETVLHHIVQMFSYDENMNPFLELVLEQNPDLSIETFEGYSPLDVACFKDNISVVDRLLTAGAKLESEGFSALHCAAKYSNVKMVQHLLKKGANPNVTTENGRTPLMISYECCGDGFGESITPEERTRTTELLLDYHADPAIKNNDGISFLDLCQQNREDRKMVRDLMVKKGYLKK